MHGLNYDTLEIQKVVIKLFVHEDKNWERGAEFVSRDGQFTLALETRHLKPNGYFFENGNMAIGILGNPIINDRISRDETAKGFLDRDDKKEFVRSLNGNFLIVYFEKRTGRLQIFNDRFTGFPLYYFFTKGLFIGSYSFNDLFLLLKKQGRLSIHKEAFFEVFFLRRLLGTKTLDHHAYFMPSAHHLSFDGERIRLDPYWVPSIKKNPKLSVRDCGIALAEKIRKSIARRTTDGKRYGLFLSGGLDTRTVLAAFPFAPVCFTATSTKEGNREYQTAAMLAHLKGAKHVHLQFPVDHFSRILNHEIKLNGGVYTNPGIFLGFKELVQEEIDVAFHGHGFDYMFQGMYIPCRYFQPCGLPLVARKMSRIHGDIVDFFLNTVSYRTKYPHIYEFVRKGYRQALREFLNCSTSEVYQWARELSSDPYDHWEFITFHFPSRHYSYPDYASIHTNAEQRCVSFDNDIYDFYFTLTAQQKFDGKVQRAALAYLSRPLCKVPSANDGLPVASSYVKSLYQLKRWSQIALGIQERNRLPDHHIRTWPTAKWLFLNDSQFKRLVLELGESDMLAGLDWIDMDAVRLAIGRFYANPEMQNSKFLCDALWGLLNFHLFLGQVR